MPTRTQNVMTGAAVTATLLLTGLTSTADAQDAVQWRVEDGGNGHWYQIVIDPDVTWAKARENAETSDGHLVTLTSMAENTWVYKTLGVDDWDQFWSGGSGTGPALGGVWTPNGEGWRWVTGETWSFENYGTGEEPEPPNSWGLSFRSVENQPQPDSTWQRVPQSGSPIIHKSYIVEWSADCNEDGIVDYGQILDGTLLDVNDNGVPDVCEAIQWRVEDGGDGRWYLPVNSENWTWSDARAAAEEAHAFLASVTSEEKTVWLSSLMAESLTGDSENAYVGGLKVAGDWAWLNGDPWDFTNWLPGNPGVDPSEIALELNYKLGTINDIDPDAVYESPYLALFEWSTDCNNDGIVDFGQILDGSLLDNDQNGIPDSCPTFVFIDKNDIDASRSVEVQLSAGEYWIQPMENPGNLGDGRSAWTGASGNETWVWKYFMWDSDDNTSAELISTYVTDPFNSSMAAFQSALNDAPIFLTVPENGTYYFCVNDIDFDNNRGAVLFNIFKQTDCNMDGIGDYEQILDGEFTDCNANLIPDICELSDLRSEHVNRTPESFTDFIDYDVSDMANAGADVTLELTARGDLAGSGEFLGVYLNQERLDFVFVGDGSACGELTATLTISADDWNDANLDGARQIRVNGSPNIDPNECTDPFVGIRVTVPIVFDDCNENGVWDACEVTSGAVNDLDGNGVPDSCDPDCDGDGEPDAYEIASGQAFDCNANQIPDACDLSGGGSSKDVDSNGIPDECQPDCDGDELPDSWELAEGLAMDCNENNHPDNCDILEATSNDIDSNGVPDECKDDCNGNGIPDYWEIAQGDVADCNDNGIPDPCDISAGTLSDCDNDLISDDCAIEDGLVFDCNENGIPDNCDLDEGLDEDDNENGTLDGCELARGDFDLDGCVTGADLALLLGLWGLSDPPVGDLNGDGTIDGMDLATLLANWGCG